jgi:hypothetical protein
MLTVQNLNYKSISCKISGFHTAVVSLVSTFEDFKPANQLNIPEDQYAQSRRY